MMGSGKSTVGVKLAERLAWAFVDLDRRVERLAGRDVPTLFAGGEGKFRRLESAALRSLLAEPGFGRRGVVVALGGGTVADPGNLAVVKGGGRSVYLRLSPAALARRLGMAGQQEARPLLRDAEDPDALAGRLSRLLADRVASYESCDLVINADASPGDVAARVHEQLLAHDKASHAT